MRVKEDESYAKETHRKQEEFKNRFRYHQPTKETGVRYQAIRDKAQEFAQLIESLCPDSREKSIAIIQLETAMFWANAAISRN